MRSLTPFSILLLIISASCVTLKLKASWYFTIGAIFSLLFQLILKQQRREKMIMFNFFMAIILLIIEIIVFRNDF